MKIKANDTVLITTGKNKGYKGRVVRTIPDEQKIVVEGANMITRHIKKSRDRAGSRIETEAPIHVSNVMVICPETGKPTRVRYEIPKNGKKYRVAAKSGANLEKPFVKSA